MLTSAQRAAISTTAVRYVWMKTMESQRRSIGMTTMVVNGVRRAKNITV
jgi:hypothetical protein